MIIMLLAGTVITIGLTKAVSVLNPLIISIVATSALKSFKRNPDKYEVVGRISDNYRRR
jgi:hypothetical protein